MWNDGIEGRELKCFNDVFTNTLRFEDTKGVKSNNKYKKTRSFKC
jgi:hypothetical protein